MLYKKAIYSNAAAHVHKKNALTNAPFGQNENLVSKY